MAVPVINVVDLFVRRTADWFAPWALTVGVALRLGFAEEAMALMGGLEWVGRMVWVEDGESGVGNVILK